jgi:hypothetical protein
MIPLNYRQIRVGQKYYIHFSKTYKLIGKCAKIQQAKKRIQGTYIIPGISSETNESVLVTRMFNTSSMYVDFIDCYNVHNNVKVPPVNIVVVDNRFFDVDCINTIFSVKLFNRVVNPRHAWWFSKHNMSIRHRIEMYEILIETDKSLNNIIFSFDTEVYEIKRDNIVLSKIIGDPAFRFVNA